MRFGKDGIMSATEFPEIGLELQNSSTDPRLASSDQELKSATPLNTRRCLRRAHSVYPYEHHPSAGDISAPHPKTRKRPHERDTFEEEKHPCW